MSEQLMPMSEELQKITEEIEKEHEETYPPGPWTTLKELKPGSVFVTMEGQRAFKSHQRPIEIDNEPETGTERVCFSMKSGDVLAFPAGDDTAVCELAVGVNQPAVEQLDPTQLIQELAEQEYDAEILHHLQVLNVQPGDIVVVKMQDELTVGRRTYFLKKYQDWFPENRVEILDNDTEVGIIRTGAPPQVKTPHFGGKHIALGSIPDGHVFQLPDGNLATKHRNKNSGVCVCSHDVSGERKLFEEPAISMVFEVKLDGHDVMGWCGMVDQG